jgi:hypothetical protein
LDVVADPEILDGILVEGGVIEERSGFQKPL